MAWIKPEPHPTSLSERYWQGLQQEQIVLPRCQDCGAWHFFPRSHCPACGSRALTWQAASGRGRIAAFTVARVPTLPEFTDEMPQLLAVVELEEGPHLNTTIVHVEPEALQVGMPVSAVFDHRPGTFTLLRFQPTPERGPRVLRAEAEDAHTVPVAVGDVESEAETRLRVDCKDLPALQKLISEDFSPWSNEVLVTQQLINQFAELSGDDYWLHTDVERSRRDSPFGTTIAHGYLVQVLISRMKQAMSWEVTGFNNMVNYGLERLRFMSPVPSGCRIHSRYRVKAAEQARSGVRLTLEFQISVVGQDKPSVTYDQIILYM